MRAGDYCKAIYAACKHYYAELLTVSPLRRNGCADELGVEIRSLAKERVDDIDHLPGIIRLPMVQPMQGAVPATEVIERKNARHRVDARFVERVAV